MFELSKTHVEVADRMREIEEITVEFVEVATQISLLQARQVTLAARLHERKNTVGCAISSHLALRAGLCTVEAKRVSRLAKRLPGLPLLNEAFMGGRLSEATADLLVKVATPENEAVLLASAESATGSQLRTIAKTYRRVRNHEDPGPDTDREEQVGYGATDEGSWSLNAHLSPGHGAEVEAVLRAAREDLKTADGEVAADKATPEPVAYTSAEVFMQVFRTYLENKVTATGRLPERFTALVHVDANQLGDDISENRGGGLGAVGLGEVAQRHAMAFGDGSWVCDRGCVIVGHPRPPGGGCPVPDCGKPKNRAARRAEGRAPKPGPGGTATDSTVAWLHGQGALDGPSLNEILCNSSLSVIVSEHGQPVTVTSSSRYATPAQYRALLTMHGHCQYPGCGRTQYLQAHHVIHHEHGGPTTLWDLASR